MNRALLLGVVVGLAVSGSLFLGACRSEDNPNPDLSMVDMSVGDLANADLSKVDLAGADMTDLANADMYTPLFAPAVGYTVEKGPIYIATADLNKDGKRDLVVVNTNDPDGTITGTVVPSSLNVLLGNGDGTFQPKISKTLAGQPYGVAVADLNGDTNSDLVIGEVDGFEYLPGSASGTPGAAVKTTYAEFGRSVAIGDIDGDGKPDIVQSDLGTDAGKIWVARGDGAGHFTVPTTFTYVSTTLLPFRAPLALRLGDMNNDGKVDVVTSNAVDQNNPGTITILLNASTSGTVAFSATPVEFTIATKTPQDLLLSQLDGNNKLDIVVANAYVGENSVTVYLSDSAASAVTFAAPATYSVGMSPVALAFADIDSDTKVDLVSCDGIGNTVTVLYGGGAGVFGQSSATRPGKESYAVGSNPVAVVAGTFNADVKIDIATANQVSNNVSVLINHR